MKTYLNTIKLWVPILLKDPRNIRFLIPWNESLKRDRNSLKDNEIWITFKAKEWLEYFLNDNLVVFEWGTGGSTIYISKRVKRLISVENSREWYQYVLKAIRDNGIINCEYILKEPKKEPNLSHTKQEIQDPQCYLSNSNNYKGWSFEAYVKAIESFQDETFDMVIVDGRARPSCILHSLNKVRVGGYLMLDNSERESYCMGVSLLADWDRQDFFGPGPYNKYFWQTSIWKKTKNPD